MDEGLVIKRDVVTSMKGQDELLDESIYLQLFETNLDIITNHIQCGWYLQDE